jgi:hypothetical protein
MTVTVNIPESVIQAFPLQERDSLRKLVELISAAVDTSIGAISLDDLADVSAASPTDTQVLTYDSGDSLWEAANAGGGGATTLAELTDVTITSPANGQILMRNNTDWANQYPNSVVSISSDTNLALGPSLVSRSFVGSYIRADGTITVTVPSDANWTAGGDEAAPGVGAEITLEQSGASAVTIAAGSGTTVNVNANLTLTTNGQYAVIGLKKVAANTWVVFGNLVAA